MGRDHQYKLWVIHKDKEQLQNLRKFITKRIKACEEMSLFTELLEENGVDIPKGDWPRKTWTEANRIRSKQAEGKLSPEDKEYFCRHGFDFNQ